MNNNNVVDEGDLLWATTTSSGTNGSFALTIFPNGEWVVAARYDDPHRPPGYTLSTDQAFPVTINNANVTGLQYGFSPTLDLDKNLVGTSPVNEGSRISYTLDVTNLVKPDGYATSLPQSQDLWLSSATGTFTNPANAAGATTGTYATASTTGRNLVGTDQIDPALANQTLPIQHVEALLQLKTNLVFRSGDSLTVAVVRQGTTVGTYTVSGNAINAFTSAGTTGLVSVNVTGIGGWTWANLTAANTGLTVTFTQASGGSAPTIDIDRFGFRVVSVAPESRTGYVYWSDITSTSRSARRRAARWRS